MINKSTLRLEMMTRLAAVSPKERRAAGALICQNLLSIEAIEAASIIFAFMPLATEPDLVVFLEQTAKEERLALPKTMASFALEFHRVANLAGLVEGKYGIFEPAVDAPVVTPGSEDVIIVPGLAFTRSGKRLGRGAGYYDRFLASLDSRPLRISPCFSWQIFDDIPVEEHDERVGWLVTEKTVISTAL